MQGESGALEGRRVNSKRPSRIGDPDEGVAGRNRGERCFPDQAYSERRGTSSLAVDSTLPATSNFWLTSARTGHKVNDVDLFPSFG